jgi:hypothetical protein
MAGEVSIEDEVVLESTIEAVTCRWCGSSQSIEQLESDQPEAQPVGSAQTV